METQYSIGVEQARELFGRHLIKTESEEIDVCRGSGRVLAEEILAPCDHPFFDQSAVDGFAYCRQDFVAGSPMHIIGESAAGNTDESAYVKGKQTIRIFTGAPLPEACDSIIMQEFVEVQGHDAFFDASKAKSGTHIRKKGEQLRKGELVLEKGKRLNASSIGLLLSLGIKKTRVGKLPSVGIIGTGDEFQDGAKHLKGGQKYESNSGMLSAALSNYGIVPRIRLCPDDKQMLTEMICECSETCDVLLITGGVSVGKYDFTAPALEAAGYVHIMHKIRQKPGKPLLFSVKDKHAAFGLPGNPRAVAICFIEYIAPYILASMGCGSPFPREIKMQLNHPVSKKDGRVHFMAGVIQNGGIGILEKQGSHMLSSLARAQCIVRIPEAVRQLNRGDWVYVHFIADNV